MQKTILVVDDDPGIRRALSLRLESFGYDVQTAQDGSEALMMTEVKEPHLMITDAWIPEGSGFAQEYRLKRLASRIPIIFTTGKGAGLNQMARELGVAAFLEKPYDPDTLLRTIAQVLDSYVPTSESESDTSRPVNEL